MTRTFDESVAIWACSEDGSLDELILRAPQIEAVVRATSRFYRALGERARDDRWSPSISRLWRFVQLATSTPLSFGHTRLSLTTVMAELRAELRWLEPEDAATPLGQDLLVRLAALESLANPMAEVLIERAVLYPETTGLLVTRSYATSALLEFCETLLSGCPWVLVSPSQARARTDLQHLVLLGHSDDTHADLLTSPRAPYLFHCRYSWQREVQEPSSYLSRSLFEPPAWTVKRGRSEPSALDPDLNEFNRGPEQATAAEVAARFANEAADLGGSAIPVPALLVRLDGAQGVFLSADPGATVLVLDLDDPAGASVEYRPVSEVRLGLSLLLRTGSDGDYLMEVADQLLGEAAEGLRLRQRKWKERLQHRIAAVGEDQVALELRQRGLQSATVQNLRYWVAPRSLRTQRKENFRILLQHLHLGDEADSYWEAMGQLFSAHTQAGRLIQQQLMAQVIASQQRGRAAWEGTGLSVGKSGEIKIAAYRVESMEPNAVLVPAYRLGQLFELEDRF